MSPSDPAESTAAVMSQADATFEAMLEVLHTQMRQAGPLTASCVMASVAAADGRDAVITAPAASSLSPAPLPSLPVPDPGAGAAAIADALSAVAGTLTDQLAAAALAAVDPQDRQALQAASMAAAKVRACLTRMG